MANSTSVGIKETAFVVGFVAVMVWASFKFSTGYISIGNDPKKMIGQPSPEIEFEESNGKKSSVKKQEGSVILITFWASWCLPCMQQMPHLEMLESHFGKEGLLILAFNIDESKDKIKGKLSGGHFPKNLIFAFSKDHIKPFNVKNLPLSVLLDKKGIVKQVYTGPQTWMEYKMVRMFSEMLK